MTVDLVDLRARAAHARESNEFTTLYPDEVDQLVAVAEVAQAWARAYAATGRCHDEFGWHEEGRAACGQCQEAEDAEATALIDALAPFAADEGGAGV